MEVKLASFNLYNRKICTTFAIEKQEERLFGDRGRNSDMENIYNV